MTPAIVSTAAGLTAAGYNTTENALEAAGGTRAGGESVALKHFSIVWKNRENIFHCVEKSG
jgi:hypothetical protein